MIRGETVPITLDFSGQDVDFTLADEILVTLEQGDCNEVTVTPTVDSATQLTVELTQEQSLGFKFPSPVYPLKIQVNFMQSNIRYASEVSCVTVGEQLFDEVIA